MKLFQPKYLSLLLFIFHTTATASSKHLINFDDDTYTHAMNSIFTDTETPIINNQASNTQSVSICDNNQNLRRSSRQSKKSWPDYETNNFSDSDSDNQTDVSSEYDNNSTNELPILKVNAYHINKANHTTEDKEFCIDLSKKGLSAQQIHAQTGISKSTISHWNRELRNQGLLAHTSHSLRKQKKVFTAKRQTKINENQYNATINALKKIKLTYASKNKHGVAYDDSSKDTIFQAFDAGMTITDIAQTSGIHISTIHDWRKKRNS
ncbi:MAG: helix-turn-helix domain-containing protein [Candidatus Chromulinivorax sp.]|nr:helix-turn-helix domain-containing protein [Candidatus Chromulinivorax sp.]